MIKYGCTRIVFLIGGYAIKFPQIKYEWKHFLLGLLANMQEIGFSKMDDKRMCPVLFYIPGGWMVVMPRCKNLSREEFMKLDTRIFYPLNENSPNEYFNVPVENKEDSFGWYKGKIVAIDYGS